MWLREKNGGETYVTVELRMSPNTSKLWLGLCLENITLSLSLYIYIYIYIYLYITGFIIK